MKVFSTDKLLSKEVLSDEELAKLVDSELELKGTYLKFSDIKNNLSSYNIKKIIEFKKEDVEDSDINFILDTYNFEYYVPNSYFSKVLNLSNDVKKSIKEETELSKEKFMHSKFEYFIEFNIGDYTKSRYHYDQSFIFFSSNNADKTLLINRKYTPSNPDKLNFILDLIKNLKLEDKNSLFLGKVDRGSGYNLLWKFKTNVNLLQLLSIKNIDEKTINKIKSYKDQNYKEKEYLFIADWVLDELIK